MTMGPPKLVSWVSSQKPCGADFSYRMKGSQEQTFLLSSLSKFQNSCRQAERDGARL